MQALVAHVSESRRILKSSPYHVWCPLNLRCCLLTGRDDTRDEAESNVRGGGAGSVMTL